MPNGLVFESHPSRLIRPLVASVLEGLFACREMKAECGGTRGPAGYPHPRNGLDRLDDACLHALRPLGVDAMQFINRSPSGRRRPVRPAASQPIWQCISALRPRSHRKHSRQRRCRRNWYRDCPRWQRCRLRAVETSQSRQLAVRGVRRAQRWGRCQSEHVWRVPQIKLCADFCWHFCQLNEHPG